MRSALLLLACTAFIDVGASITSAPPTRNSTDTSLVFTRITLADGLVDNTVNCLYRDAQGYLWIGTEAGLNKYDGNHFWTWQRSDGLGGEQVSDVLMDAEGTAWVATRDGGLSRIASTGEVTAYKHDAHDATSIPVDRLTCLLDLNDTTLMIGAEQVPIMFMDKRTGRFTSWSGTGPISPARAVPRPLPSSDWCHYMQRIGKDRIAIGFLLAHNQVILDASTGNIIEQTFVLSPDDQTITDLARCGDLLCGAGWQPHLTVRALSDPSRATWNIPLPDEALGLATLDERHVLIGTRTKGLVLVNVATGTERTITHRASDRRSLSDDRVRCVLLDAEGRTWVGTSNGLNVHDPSTPGLEAVPLYGDPSAERSGLNAYHIDVDSAGRTVVSTNDGLFFRRSDGTFKHVVPMYGGHPLETTGLFHTSIGDVLGTEYGIYRYDAERNEVRELFPPDHQEPSPFGYTHIVQVRNVYTDTLDGHPALVVGNVGYGIVYFDLETPRFRLAIAEDTLPRSIRNNLVRRLLRTRSGIYWAGTPAGLFRWDLDRTHVRNAFDAYGTSTTAHALPGNDVQDLLEDGAGKIWVALRDGGLARISNGLVTSFACPRPQGNTMFRLAMDADGRIWCITANGVEVLDPSDGSFFHIAVDGMQGSAALGCSMARIADGRIAFVAGSTFFLADPAGIFVRRALPLPYLTGLFVDGRQAMRRILSQTLDLAADEKSLTISVSALRLTGIGPLSFSVRLEGVDEVPHLAHGTETITYTSLPSGTFRLFARGVDSSGALGPEVMLALVNVAAPFWQRWWFYVILTVIVSAGAMAWSRYRLRQIMALQAVRNRIASDLHDEVGSSLSSITIGSQLISQLSSKENEQVKKLVARIGETSSQSLRSMSDIVWAIDPKNDEGEALVKRMRRIAQELLESQGIDVRLTVDGGVEELRLPMSARKEMVLLYKEAVHNASKYSNARTVDVMLQRKSGTLILRVHDDGIGFDPHLHTDGHGLGSMKRRAEAIGGTFSLTSTPGIGTTVEMQVLLARIGEH